MSDRYHPLFRLIFLSPWLSLAYRISDTGPQIPTLRKPLVQPLRNAFLAEELLEVPPLGAQLAVGTPEALVEPAQARCPVGAGSGDLYIFSYRNVPIHQLQHYGPMDIFL